MRVRTMLFGAVLCVCFAPLLRAQDAVKVDPKHYKVESENDQVRILRVHYGPHEKSVMHAHPALLAVFLTDAKGDFTFADGKKAGVHRESRSGDVRTSSGPSAGEYGRCGHGPHSG